MKSGTALVVVFVCSTVLATDPAQRTLTFEDRVIAQRAIEQVYWSHRIWPKENPGPKPALSAVISDEAIREKVDDYLRKSKGLQTWWQRPITGEQLQAEIDRMAKNSRDPRVLQELFSALHNDPYVIAETLGRQTLAGRLIPSWYANDTRFHATVRATAEAARAGCSSASCMKTMGGEYREAKLKLRSQRETGDQEHDAGQSLILGSPEWNAALGRLAGQFGVSPESIPPGKLTGVDETTDAFVVSSVLALTQDEIVTAAVVWPKQSFDAWWASQKSSITSDVSDTSSRFKLPKLPSSGCQDDTWSATRQDVPDERTDHTAVWTGAEMIVWGGFDGESPLASGARYDPSTDTWAATSVGLNLPDARDLHTAVWTGTEMIVWGGAGDNGWLDSGGRYDPTTDSWKSTSRGVNVPTPRYIHTAVWTGDEMIVWGGIGPGFLRGTNSGGRYNPVTDSWAATSVGDNVPEPRDSHTAVWTGTEMIVWGGYHAANNGPSAAEYLSSGGRYDPSTDRWLPTSNNAPSGREGHAAVWTGTVMIIWGGYALQNNYPYFPIQGGRYDPSTDTWTSTSTGLSMPEARENPTAVWTGTEMLLWGGANYYILDSGALYNPSTNTWRATASVNAPRARYHHSGVWTGTEMIVWGGAFGQRIYSKTGARYSPTSNSWVPISNAAVEPASRYSHTAVWTGSELIIWGGSSYDGAFSYYNSGGRYDPATDGWTATSIGTAVPAPREEHTAIWTGTEMIVWGGRNYSTWFDSGGRFSPISNAWTPMATGSNPPSARASHTAIWTGSKMIVWGGRSESDTNTGGLYDPMTDEWLPTSTGSNVPEPRYAHSAVWSGTEMIVWGGGRSNYSVYNSGGRYDPLADRWLPTSRGMNVPVPRTDHTAIWTGTEMIVWGGHRFDRSYGWFYYNAGGRYDPATNTWKETSTSANTPSARQQHTAAWTGLEMIVWGGFDFDHAFNSGGRYNPHSDTWTSTAADATTPKARGDHTAVWTGPEMIVWGGWPTTSSGGRYCAHNRCFDDAGPASCDDANPCTEDSCDPFTGCVHTDNSDPCDDGNPCTSNDSCTEGVCVGHSGCEDGLPCTDDVANPADNCACSNPISLAGTACIDGNRCTLGTTCDGFGGGVADCGGGTALSCDDGNPCTDDACDPATGCSHTSNASACDDGNVCTTADTCVSGNCHGGPPLGCDDGNVCTDDACDEATGCFHTYNYNPCDDGTACTEPDYCSYGTCRGTPGGCDDDNACTNDSCVSGKGCIHDNNAFPCDDGNACTWDDRCGDGSCHPGIPLDCDDYEICTTDSCDPATGCVHSPNSNACEDGNLCTSGDTCDDGWCHPGPATNCDDGDPCTTDSCVYYLGCVNTPRVSCDDGNACTTGDTCATGFCRGTAIVCNDNNTCTNDSCDPATGCVFANNNNPCDDGNACTTNDRCTSSIVTQFFAENFDGVTAPALPFGFTSSVAGTGTRWVTRNMSSETAPNSAYGLDSSQRADETLETPTFAIASATARLTFRNRWSFEDASTCYDAGVIEIKIGSGSYTDILAAGGSFFSGGYTGRVVSFSGNPLAGRSAWCAASFGYPAYLTTGVNLPAAAAGQIIRLRWRIGSDSASASVGQDIDSIVIADSARTTCNGGPPPDCDDNNPCTDDSCNPSIGCVHASNFNPCNDGNACTSGDTCGGGSCHGAAIDCDDHNPCTTDTCNPMTGCIVTNNSIACNDGNACTTGDACEGGSCHGTTIVCNDNNSCTTDSCNPTIGCVFTNNTSVCNDGNACTRTDICANGACTGSNMIVCCALDQCHVAGVCDPGTGACSNPTKPNGTVCGDASLCTTGETCQSGTCTPAFSGLNFPKPKSAGYYRKLCEARAHNHPPYQGDQLTDADSSCVGQLTSTFTGFSTIDDICNVIYLDEHGGRHHGGSGDGPDGKDCDKGENELIATALNICRARVCEEQDLDSRCRGNTHTTVSQSLTDANAILDNAARDKETCKSARCELREINNGHALEMNSLVLAREHKSVRLGWSSPVLDDGSGTPNSYEIWRRPMGSNEAFVKIGTTTETTYLDAAAGTAAWEYDITAVIPGG